MLVRRWHTWVNQPVRDESWHRDDIADEYAEYLEARGLIHKWSELSDIVYTVTRASWSGHKLDFPISRPQRMAGYVYMFPKYTSRTLFFRRAGKKAGADQKVLSVRNPKKAEKLHKIAGQYGIDPQEFQAICERQRRYWPLLP
jgi:hypothetical protein